MRRILAVLLLTATFAACIDNTETGSGQSDPRRLGIGRDSIYQAPISAGWSELALPQDQDHSHGDHSQHFNLSTSNFEVVGYDPLVTDYYGRTAGSHLCGDAKELEGRRLSVVHSFSSDVALIIIDVTDPEQPEKIGELAMAQTHVYDLAITPDFQYVLLATSPLGSLDNAVALLPENPPLFATFKDACTGEEHPIYGPEAGLPFASGLVLVDIANPRAPNVVDFRMFPYLGGHSVSVSLVNGEPIIVTSVANIPGQTSYYVFLSILETPVGGKLEVVSVYQDVPMDPQEQAAMAVVTNHDGMIQKHPITGQYIAYLSYGNWGLVLLDMDDPANPQYLSRIVPWDHVPKADANAGYIHEAVPIDEVWDGKHFTFVGDECGGHPVGTPTCLAYAIDTTDPRTPLIAGAWTLPHDVAWTSGLQFSLHYLGYYNKTLFTTVYHGGLWAVDVSQLTSGTPTSLPSIGVFMPPYVSPKPPPGATIGYSPRVNDLNVFPDGILVVYDAHTGLYTVRFHDENPAPAPEPWPLQ